MTNYRGNGKNVPHRRLLYGWRFAEKRDGYWSRTWEPRWVNVHEAEAIFGPRIRGNDGRTTRVYGGNA